MEHKYKICAYAICKNEEKFIEAWYNGVKEADLIVVGDTGSTDSTIEKLRALGATVHELKLPYFRFDRARNETLALIPEDVDICLSTDLEAVVSPDWRECMERVWSENTNRGVCHFNWSHNPDGSPGVSYPHQRIHARKNYKWLYPTHEIVAYTGEGKEKEVFIPGMIIDHYPDMGKNRSFNMHLLEIAIEENPDAERNYHYLGREYMYAGEWTKCIETLIKHLNLPSTTWKEERSASMRFIARAYKALKDYPNARAWLHKAIAEQQYLREPYIEMAMLSEIEKDWQAMFYFASAALKITDKALGYANEAFAWDHTPYDLMAISCYWLGMGGNAKKYSETAMKKSPNNERLIANHRIYTDMKNYPKNNFK